MTKPVRRAFAEFVTMVLRPPMAQAPQDNVDYLYVTAVEHAVKGYGTEVVWINLPQKRPTSTR